MTSSTYLSSMVYPRTPTPTYPSSEGQAPPRPRLLGMGCRRERNPCLGNRREPEEGEACVLALALSGGGAAGGLALRALGPDRSGPVPACCVTWAGGQCVRAPASPRLERGLDVCGTRAHRWGAWPCPHLASLLVVPFSSYGCGRSLHLALPRVPRL